MFLYTPIESVDVYNSVNTSNIFILDSGTRYTVTVVGTNYAWGDLSGYLYIYNNIGGMVEQFSIYEYFDGDAQFSTSFKDSFTVSFSGAYYMEFHPSEYDYYGEIKIVIQEGTIENLLNIDMLVLFVIGGGIIFIAIIFIIIASKYDSNRKNNDYDDSSEAYEEIEEIKTLYCSNCGRKADGTFCEHCGIAIEE